MAVALGLLLWGADSAARLGAETLLARNIQDSTGVTERPEVTVRGWFFLPQVIRGAYHEVDVTTRGLTTGPLRVDQVNSRLYDVRVPFHDVLVRDVRRVGVGTSQEEVTLRYADLNAYFEATGRSLELGPAEDGSVQVIGTAKVLGRPVQATATVDLSVSQGTLRVEPRSIDTGPVSMGPASELLLGQRLTVTVPLGALPFGHQLVDAKPYPDGVHLTARGSAVILQP